VYPEANSFAVHRGICPANAAFTKESDISLNSLLFMPKLLACRRTWMFLLNLPNFLFNSESKRLVIAIETQKKVMIYQHVQFFFCLVKKTEAEAHVILNLLLVHFFGKEW
jgi:hypothetical protein